VRKRLDLVEVAARAARRAARYLRTVRPPPPDAWTEKGRHDFATEADRRAEALIAEMLTTLVPGSLVVGEELSPTAARRSGVVWIVDPLDGTTNFLHGYPQYAVSIAAVRDGVLSAAVVHDVPRGLVYRAARGHGAWLGRARLAVSPISDPRHSLVGTGFPFRNLDLLEPYLRQFATVTRAASGIRRAGSAAIDLADLAAGRFDAFWEPALAPWDVAAGVLLVREAGGVVTTFDGSDDVLDHGSIVAGNPAMHRWLIDLIGSA